MHRPTVEVYEHHADDWLAQRRPVHVAVADELRALTPDGPVADLGCGPGWYSARLGPGAIALDAARAMLDLASSHAPGVPRLQGDLAHLPYRRGGLVGAQALRSYVHLARVDVPMALADLHRAVRVGGVVRLALFSGDTDLSGFTDDAFADGRRRFSRWPVDLLRHVLDGAGFTVSALTVGQPGRNDIDVIAVRAPTLADVVGPGMRLLVCGLNPSVYSADVGVGYARPGNRFWPAAIRAGLVTSDRDPVDALARHRIGLTDLVKRATVRADELSTEEYRRGLDRLEALCRWLRPGAVCFVGLAGWRAAVDRRAAPGPQDRTVGGRPVYVMPSTSGLNARIPLTELADHLKAAADLADRADP
jgi:TDG/mug DNA glycosylase family protein